MDYEAADVTLRDIAHARTGDKGDTVQHLGHRVRRARLSASCSAHVTAERVKAHFAGIVRGDVVRYELPQLGALNFVHDAALGGGVTRSLALDAHGKSLSSALLTLDLPE